MDYKKLMSSNVNCVTMGNHTYSHRKINDFIEESKIIRPYNIIGEKGFGYLDINYNGKIITVISLLGTWSMNVPFEITNPFVALDEFLNEHKSDYVIVDIHAEATSEKIAIGHAFDGRVDVVYGTHTHVQTSDETILPKKTLYITDVGMTGPFDGVLGTKKEIIIDRFWHGGTEKFEVSDGPCQLNAIIVDLGFKREIKRISIKEAYK